MPLCITNSSRAVLCGFDQLGYLRLFVSLDFLYLEKLQSSDVKD